MRGWIRALPVMVAVAVPHAASAQDDSAGAMAAPSGAELGLARYPTDGVDAVARVFVPGGAGPHPVLILFHGFPGAELNFDVAHAAMRHGWAVVIPHYRGSWGVAGDYSFAHAVEDGEAVLAWVRGGRGTERFHFDRDRIAVAGHSAGGLVAFRLAAEHPEVIGVAGIAAFDFGAFADHAVAGAGSPAEARSRAIAATAKAWASSAAVLHGATGKGLAEEAFAHGPEWRLAATAPALRTRAVLLVAARSDEIAIPGIHFSPLVEAFREAGAGRVTARVLPGGHGFEDSREELTRVVVEWLGGLVGHER